MKIPTFKSGIHPEESKHFTESLPIETLPEPKEVFIPLQQHIGAPCKPIVEVGDEVKIGQVIGSSDAFVSSPVHATINGKVKDISRYNTPTGTRSQMIHIVATEEEDGEKLAESQTRIDWNNLSIDD